MKSVVISLKKSIDRRATISERLLVGGVEDYELYDAIDRVETMPTKWKKDSRLKNMLKNERRKCCYMSHLNVIRETKTTPILIMEDDIYFTEKNIIPDTLKLLPDDAFMAFWDCSNIEEFEPIDKTRGWCLIEPDKAYIWCAGCYYIKYPLEVYETLTTRPSKVYDKCLIDYFHKEKPCYVWYPPSCFQDRKIFQSNIVV